MWKCWSVLVLLAGCAESRCPERPSDPPTPPPATTSALRPGGACVVAGTPLAVIEAALARESAEGRPREQIRFESDRDRATLEVVRDGLLDDSVASDRAVYDLRWTAGQGWAVSSCGSEVLRCYRGSPPICD